MDLTRANEPIVQCSNNPHYQFRAICGNNATVMVPLIFHTGMAGDVTTFPLFPYCPIDRTPPVTQFRGSRYASPSGDSGKTHGGKY